MMARLLVLALALGLAQGRTLPADAQRPPHGVQPFVLAPASGAPCDIFAAAGTPCIAAHSVTRRMLAAYKGPLYEIERASDSATLAIHSTATAPWPANPTPAVSFCSGTTCSYYDICDQITGRCGTGENDLPAGGAVPLSWDALSTGQIVPRVATYYESSYYYFRNRTNTDLPTGTAAPTTEYMVIDTLNGTHSSCCGSYGNMEATVNDNGDGHMFALAFGSSSEGHSGSGSGPWPGVDWENGVYFYGASPTQTYLNIIAKYFPSGPTWELKSGDATTGSLSTLYDSSLPSGYTADFEGGISLGEGGDGSHASVDFLEGAILATDSSDMADNAVQSNITAFYGPSGVSCTAGNLIANSLGLGGQSWTQSGVTIAAAEDPYGGLAAELFSTNTSGTYAYTYQVNVPVAASTVYTFTDYVAKTSGATVFPADSIVTNGSGGEEFAIVMNTNTGAAVAGTWAAGAPTSLSSTAAGNWWQFKMVFTSTGSATAATTYVDGPIANGSGARSGGIVVAGQTATHFCPLLQSGSH